MFTAIVMKEARENRWKWLLFGAILLATAILAQVLHGSIVGLVGDLGNSKLTNQLQSQLADPMLYHWGNWYGKNLYQMTTVFAVLSGMAAVAGEVSRGTAPFLFTRPISRQGILWAKVLGGYGPIAITMTVCSFLVLVVARVGGMSLPIRFLSGLPMSLLGALVLYLLAVLASAFFDDQVKAGAAAAALMVLFALPGFFAKTAEYSIFRQMSGPSLLAGEPWPAGVALLLLAVSAGLFSLIALVLRRREFSR